MGARPMCPRVSCNCSPSGLKARARPRRRLRFKAAEPRRLTCGRASRRSTAAAAAGATDGPSAGPRARPGAVAPSASGARAGRRGGSSRTGRVPLRRVAPGAAAGAAFKPNTNPLPPTVNSYGDRGRDRGQSQFCEGENVPDFGFMGPVRVATAGFQCRIASPIPRFAARRDGIAFLSCPNLTEAPASGTAAKRRRRAPHVIRVRSPARRLSPRGVASAFQVGKARQIRKEVTAGRGREEKDRPEAGRPVVPAPAGQALPPFFRPLFFRRRRAAGRRFGPGRRGHRLPMGRPA